MTYPTEQISLRNETSKTSEIAPGVFSLECGGNNYHYKNGGGVWQPVDFSSSDTPFTSGFSHYFSKGRVRAEIGASNGVIRVYPISDSNDKYVEFRAHPTNNISLNVSIVDSQTVRIYRNTADVYYSFILFKNGFKISYTLKNSSAPNSYTIGFKLFGLSRVGRKLYDNDKFVCNLPNPWLEDANGVIRNVTETINGTSVVLTANLNGLSYPVIIDPTLEVQPSTIDTNIRSLSSDLNYGAQQTALLGHAFPSGNNNKLRYLGAFDYSALPDKAIVSSAVLSIKQTAVAGNFILTPQTFTCYPIIQTGWGETTVTWNRYDGSTSWDSAGGDYIQSPSAALTISDNNTDVWREWNVKSMVAFWTNAGEVLHFIIMGPETAGTGVYVTLATNNYVTANDRPKLTIVYAEYADSSTHTWGKGSRALPTDATRVILNTSTGTTVHS